MTAAVRRRSKAQERATANLTISENGGTGERLDMLCGRFVLTRPHDRFLRDYLPVRLVVHAAAHSASTARPGTGAQLANLVSLMRVEFGRRQSRRPRHAQCIFNRLVRTDIAPRQRSGGSAGRLARARRKSTPGAGPGGDVSKPRTFLDAARIG